MSARTSSESPRPWFPPAPSDTRLSSFTSGAEEKASPTSTAALSAPILSNRAPTSVSDGEGSESSEWQAEPQGQVTQQLALSATRSESDDGSESADRGESADPRPVFSSGRPKLVRRDWAVDLTAARQQFEYARIVQQATAGNKLDIATSRHMAYLIRWLASGAVAKSLHFECDFGGPHCFDDPDYDNREVLDRPLLKRLLEVCTGIKQLIFDECRLSQDSFQTLAAFLMQQDCKLEVLHLLDEAVDEQCAAALARALRSNRSLRELSLGGTFACVSSTAMAMIIKAVARTPSITVLKLEPIRGCMIWPSQLASVLASGSRVQLAMSSSNRVRLHLQDLNEWDGSFAEFCEQLAKDSTLRSLDLSGFDLNDANIGVLLAALQRNACLERLELGRIALTDEQRALITHCLELNEANNQVARQVAEWQAAKVLDKLVPALLSPGDVWPNELSLLIASMMEAGALEAMKKSGLERIEPGNPKPGNPKPGRCTQS